MFLQKSLNLLQHLINWISDKPIPCADIPPVFILGCSHSGTTLMMAILARHPDFYVINYESGIFFPEFTYTQVENFYNQQKVLANRKRMVEKTPRHIFELSRLFRLFPNAQVIAMMRDGRDVAVSIRRRKGTLASALKLWLDAAQSIRYWRNDCRVKIIKYEKLVVAPEECIEEILTFLNTPGNPQTLLNTGRYVEFRGGRDNAFKDIPADNEHLMRRRQQINQDIYDDRGRWITEMTDDDKDYVRRAAGKTLAEWGYL